MSSRCLLREVPRRLWLAVVVLVVLAPMPFVLIAWSRATPSPRPRVQLIQDMGIQPVLKPQAYDPAFSDRRGMRLPPLGAVAHDDLALREDPRFYRGVEMVNGQEQWITSFPEQGANDPHLTERGRERFNIYCSVCHGEYGYGNGPVAERAKALSPSWVPPASLRDDKVRSQANGYIFSVITNGIRTMPSYASQIPVADRWAVIAYIRDLQNR